MKKTIKDIRSSLYKLQIRNPNFDVDLFGAKITVEKANNILFSFNPLSYLNYTKRNKVVIIEKC